MTDDIATIADTTTDKTAETTTDTDMARTAAKPAAVHKAHDKAVGLPPSAARAAPSKSVDASVREQVKMKDFIDRVVARSGMKRGEVKTAVEAALAELGSAVAAGEELNLPPLGKIKISRHKATPRGTSYNLRLVRNDSTDGPKEARPKRAVAPLAEPGEDG